MQSALLRVPNRILRELVPHQVYIGIESNQKSGQEVDVFMVL